MTIHLTPEQERIVQNELKSGRFRTVEEVVAEALNSLRERQQSAAGTAANGEQREAVRQMLEFAEKNRTWLVGVSVRQLIHEGHPL
jgi:Arc/MetJ-type ribon-helix-helix transcriptional regulator